MSFDPRLVARVQIPATVDMPSVIRAAGGDPANAVFAAGWLTVRGISQEALTAAAEPADPLYSIRVTIKAEAEAEFRRRLSLGMPFRGKVADIDEEQSQRRINGAVTGALLAASQNAPFEISWRMKDNDALDLDGVGVMTLGSMVLAYFQMLNMKKWAIIGAATEAADAAALSAINPLAGWPDPPPEPAPPSEPPPGPVND